MQTFPDLISSSSFSVPESRCLFLVRVHSCCGHRGCSPVCPERSWDVSRSTCVPSHHLFYSPRPSGGLLCPSSMHSASRLSLQTALSTPPIAEIDISLDFPASWICTFSLSLPPPRLCNLVAAVFPAVTPLQSPSLYQYPSPLLLLNVIRDVALMFFFF